jgi:uncharacterized protein YyaL (SSP411 family)
MIRFSPNPNRAHLIRWHEWDDEAFCQAQAQDKPVMLFLSAFWCRICQRMDEGAFSDEDNIALLNAFFIAVRAENAKRPDVDVRYNLNGWPTVIFMTPQGELLTVTNYLPSEDFGTLLARMYAGYHEKKGEIPIAGGEKVGASTGLGAGGQPSAACVAEISQLIMDVAERVHGGYGRGQKFIHPEANDFLLSRYETTKDASYLDHVCMTLDRMSDGHIHDHDDGGYFRTCSNEDWTRPHREKLLAEQAGLLSNCLRTFKITQRPEYARMAEEIIHYLDRTLLDPSTGAFYGCEDFLRNETAASGEAEYRSFLDRCIYADANARVILAYLDASSILGNAHCQDRALKALEFLWAHCRSAQTGMYHYFDGAPRVPGLLNDQARVGSALVHANKTTGKANYLEWAKELAEFILARLKNPQGGYYDLSVRGPAHLNLPLTLIEQNAAAALFFLALAEITREGRYREAALWALSAFTGDFSFYGIHAAAFGRALSEFLIRHQS